MSGAVNRVNKTSDKGEEKMKNLMILILLLFVAVACKSEVVEEATPAVEEAKKAVEEVLPEEVIE